MGNGLWIVTGSGGNSIATSTNGINWTGKVVSGFTNGNSVAFKS
jgi:hypothetical protein